MAASPAALMVSACSDTIAPAVVTLPCVRRPMAPPAWAVASLPMDRSPTEVRFNAPVVALALPSSASLPPVRRQVAVAAQAALEGGVAAGLQLQLAGAG